jgi:hypothetical protein
MLAFHLLTHMSPVTWLIALSPAGAFCLAGAAMHYLRGGRP